MKPSVITTLGACLLGILPLQAETPAQFIEKIYSSKNPSLVYLDKEAIPLYTPALQKQMQAAIKLNARFIKDHPEDKPPLAEYFLLLPGPDQFSKVGVFAAPIDKSSKQQLVIVEIRYPQVPLRDYAFITLTPKDNSWQISDIRWNREEHAADSETLKKQLDSLIREYTVPDQPTGTGQPAAKPATMPQSEDIR